MEHGWYFEELEKHINAVVAPILVLHGNTSIADMIKRMEIESTTPTLKQILQTIVSRRRGKLMQHACSAFLSTYTSRSSIATVATPKKDWVEDKVKFSEFINNFRELLECRVDTFTKKVEAHLMAQVFFLK